VEISGFTQRFFSAISNIIEQKEQENVEYFSYMCSMITNDARCTREIKSRIVILKKILFTNKLDLNLRKKLVKCYIWSVALCGAEIWTLRKVDQNYLGSFEYSCCSMKGKISWTDSVKKEEVLQSRRRGISYT
jgi:hypothetical protein